MAQVPSGESLLALEKSVAVREFEGIIATRAGGEQLELPHRANPERREWLPRRIVAIDGSTVTHRVKNGFPSAEASLLMLSVVFIDITRLASIKPSEIPSPRIFHEMDSSHTLDAVLPGANVVRGGVDDDTPKAYFRKTAYEAFLGHLDPGHETLLETLRAITTESTVDITCPLADCSERFRLSHGEYRCSCGRAEALFETDALRFHERFSEDGPNGEVHSEVKRVLEVLALINMLRFFEQRGQLHFLRDAAFVLDGPLAVFGQPARISPFVKKEIQRISAVTKAAFNQDLLIMGIEKSGSYVSHFRDLDWSESLGPKKRFLPGTVFIPDAKYINKNIVRRPESAKPSGEATYFGRKAFYKNRHGSQVTLNLAMVNSAAQNFNDVSEAAFPRLGDAMNIVDHLATYLQEDGFMPLIRSQAHAAIPLRQGAEILSALFEGGAV